jgi:flagellar protein FliO/FliZ
MNSNSLWQVSISLILVIGLIMLLSYLYKRTAIGKNRCADSFKVVSSLALGTKEKLVIVEVGGTQLLLGVTPQSIHHIHSLTADEKGSLDSHDEKTFTKKLKEVIGK